MRNFALCGAALAAAVSLGLFIDADIDRPFAGVAFAADGSTTAGSGFGNGSSGLGSGSSSDPSASSPSEGLQALQSGKTGHFVVAPATPMTFETYQGLLNRIELGNFNVLP